MIRGMEQGARLGSSRSGAFVGSQLCPSGQGRGHGHTRKARICYVGHGAGWACAGVTRGIRGEQLVGFLRAPVATDGKVTEASFDRTETESRRQKSKVACPREQEGDDAETVNRREGTASSARWWMTHGPHWCRTGACRYPRRCGGGSFVSCVCRARKKAGRGARLCGAGARAGP